MQFGQQNNIITVSAGLIIINEFIVCTPLSSDNEVMAVIEFEFISEENLNGRNLDCKTSIDLMCLMNYVV